MEAGHRRQMSGVALQRLLLALLAWWILSQDLIGSLWIGLPTALVAVWASLHLAPPGRWRIRLLALPRFSLFFIRASILAGLDILRRTLHPDLPLQPGVRDLPINLPSGQPLWLFMVVISLLPGTLSVSLPAAGVVRLHCLDISAEPERDAATLVQQIRQLYGLEANAE